MSKISGTMKEAIGATKEKIGNITHNESLAAKGAAQNAEGHMQKEAANANRNNDGLAQNSEGYTQRGVGDVHRHNDGLAQNSEGYMPRGAADVHRHNDGTALNSEGYMPMGAADVNRHNDGVALNAQGVNQQNLGGAPVVPGVPGDRFDTRGQGNSAIGDLGHNI